MLPNTLTQAQATAQGDFTLNPEVEQSTIREKFKNRPLLIEV